MTARALICLDGGDLWLAELKGHPWSAERLGQLADVIRTPVKFRADRRTLDQRAEDALQLPGVVVRRPSLDDLDARAWSMRPIAVALVLAHALSSSTQVCSADVQELMEALNTALRAALETLNRALDPQALEFAVRHPEIAAELYSYLSEPARRRYRLQFATTFPLLLPAVLAVDASSPFHPVRAAIDEGGRAVHAGATALGVSPATMRCLIGQSLEVVGSRWVATPPTLLRLLDSLRPEARPGRGGHTWEHLNCLVHCCEEATGRRVDDSFFVRAWIREQLHRAGTRAAPATGPDFAAREVAAVDLFRQELLAVLVVESCSARTSTRGIAQAIATYVDRELQQFTLKTLLRLARDWQERLDHERLADRSLVEFVRSRGERYWPLLQRPHTSDDRSRRVVPLATAEQLVEHGQALGICLASDLVRSYISACRKGRIFILGIRDLDTGRPLSTAELLLTRKAEAGPIAAVVVQHTGASNAIPSVRCRTALSEALQLVQSDPGQAHLRVGLAALRTFREPAAASLSRVEAQASIRAFKIVMGDARVDTMLQGARHVAGVAGSARPPA